MVYTQSGRGTYMIDKAYKGVGRIQRASGTKNKATYSKIVGVLDLLHDRGKVGVLIDIKAGVITPLDAYDAHQGDELESLQNAKTIKPLYPALRTHLKEDGGLAAETLRGYLGCIKVLEEKYPDKKIGDIPEVLRQYRLAVMKAKKGGRSFDQTKAVLQGFVRKSLGKKDGGLWQEISDIPKAKYKTAHGQKLRVPDVIVLASKFGDEELRRMALTLCTTGMRTSEYVGNVWKIGKTAIEIAGQKTVGSERMVPLVVVPVTVGTRWRSFTKKLRTISNKKITPRDFRHTYRHWLDMAGVPTSRAEVYQGHATSTMLQTYTHHDVEQYLVEDRKKIVAYLRAELKKAKLSSTAIKFAGVSDTPFF